MCQACNKTVGVGILTLILIAVIIVLIFGLIYKIVFAAVSNKCGEYNGRIAAIATVLVLLVIMFVGGYSLLMRSKPIPPEGGEVLWSNKQ